jgi:hypothetical protein
VSSGGRANLLLAYTAHSSTLKAKAVFFSETPVNFYQTKLRHISQDSILQDIFILLIMINVQEYHIAVFLKLFKPKDQ